jgi:hypothetical protein
MLGDRPKIFNDNCKSNLSTPLSRVFDAFGGTVEGPDDERRWFHRRQLGIMMCVVWYFEANRTDLKIADLLREYRSEPDIVALIEWAIPLLVERGFLILSPVGSLRPHPRFGL